MELQRIDGGAFAGVLNSAAPRCCGGFLAVILSGFCVYGVIWELERGRGTLSSNCTYTVLDLELERKRLVL
jgi:hypothetical protein